MAYTVCMISLISSRSTGSSSAGGLSGGSSEPAVLGLLWLVRGVVAYDPAVPGTGLEVPGSFAVIFGWMEPTIPGSTSRTMESDCADARGRLQAELLVLLS